MRKMLIVLYFLGSFLSGFSQLLVDDFEGNTTIESWFGDDCILEAPHSNPNKEGINQSNNVLLYHDIGGVFANIRFDSPTPIRLTNESSFSFKIYVPSSGITGNQPNQVSLKLQNNRTGAPWTTQSEIIKPLVLDSWQEVRFNFATDPFINLDPGSPHPLSRSDFNRVLIQINGEDNTDRVLAYIDDFTFEGGNTSGGENPVYDALVWADEFDQNGAIDDSKWFHQTILPNGDNWFNGEIQHYTDRLDNSYVDNGVLSIVAKRENFTDQGVTKQFTSARLNSKFAFTYGRVEVRAKLPTGIGTWPAIWMLGKNIEEIGTYWDIEGYGTHPWPACGEIDIMEHWGHNQNFVQSAMHTPSSFGGTVNHGGQVVPTVSTAFHVYALDWYPDKMVFSVDDVVHYTYEPNERNPSTWPFDKDQFILLNIAIEPSIQPNFTESSMEIDYVRIYQEQSLNTTSNENTHELKLSPNPANHLLNITLPETYQESEIHFFSIQGAQIESHRAQPGINTIDLSQWHSGVYLVQWKGSSFSTTCKIVKN